MYTDEDLSTAAEQGIFNPDSVQQFRHFIAQRNNTNLIDEENFRLISSFNDVFVVIASCLLLGSMAWLGATVAPWLGAMLFTVGCWCLAEFFVRKRRMALPAIGLTLSFLVGAFALPITFTEHLHTDLSEGTLMLSGLLTLIAARVHWLRFKVPITVALGSAALAFACIAAVLSFSGINTRLIFSLIFVAGLTLFGFAMYWDASDRKRATRRSDVAFWLHLIAAPMLVHPIFSSLDILAGVDSMAAALGVLALYVLLGLISIAVDRRAIMVSALMYVIIAFSSLINTYGLVSYSLAITGICIGGSLLVLSAYWQTSRSKIVSWVPQPIQQHLAEVRI